MILKSFIPKSIKAFLRETFQSGLKISLEKAAKEQGVKSIADKLTEIVPDITNQYSTFQVDDPYLKVKV